MSPEEQRRRLAVRRLAVVWTSGWTKARADAYHAAIADQDPDDVEAACTELVGTWTGLVIPPPAEILAITRVRRRNRDTEHKRRIDAAAERRQRTAPSRVPTQRICRTCQHRLTLLVDARTIWCDHCHAVIPQSAGDGKRVMTIPADEVRDLVAAAAKEQPTDDDGRTPRTLPVAA